MVSVLPISIILTYCLGLCFRTAEKEANQFGPIHYTHLEVRMKISFVGAGLIALQAIAFLGWIGLSSEPTFAQAAKLDGKALYEKSGCTACHGVDAKKTLMPNYPKLAGQNGAYALAQMKDIRDGKRTSGQSAVMKPIVAALKDDALKAIAEYLEKLK